jgi:hypothetical protein
MELKDTLVRSQDRFRRAQAPLHERMMHPTLAAPSEEPPPAADDPRTRTRSRSGRQLTVPRITSPVPRERPSPHERPSADAAAPTADDIERLCAPIDMSWADQPPQTPWRQQVEALRALQVPPEPTDEGEPTLQDRLISVLVPAAPPRPSSVESMPWLSHTFLEELELALRASGLCGETTDDDAAGGETSESDQGNLAALLAKVNEVNRELAELREEILDHLPEWTEHRNMRLAVRAAFDDTP